MKSNSLVGCLWVFAKWKTIMRPPKHIIDVLIEERAPHLAASPFWPAIRFGLNILLNYKRAMRMADTITPLDGVQAMAEISALLNVRTRTTGFDHIPKSGRCIIIANHPTGIGDGIAAWDAIKAIRPDLMFYANADAHRVCPRFTDVLIPVEWELHKRTRDKTRETLRLTALAFEQERALFIFPAGKLSRLKNGILTEPDWMNSAVTLARKNNAPIVPVYMTGPNSFWFHFFDRFSGELRDITLFKELLNKKNQLFTFVARPPILPEDLAGDAQIVTERLKRLVTLEMAAGKM
jgi:putative hemolysin